MGTRKHLRSVGVQRAIVDVQETRNQAGKGRILSCGLDCGVGKEESTGNQSANRHGVFAAKQLCVAHVSCNNRTGNTANVGNAVVAPRFEGGSIKDSAVVGKVGTEILVSKRFRGTMDLWGTYGRNT